MCTVILFHKVPTVSPLIVAANRDESAGRPTAMPRYLNARVFAPQDLVYKGSWIGINRSGLLVAVTYRSGNAGNITERRSRGLLVTEMLAAAHSARQATELFAADREAFNPFNLVMADENEAWLGWSDGADRQKQRLEPGMHVITEKGFGSNHSARAANIQKRLTSNSNAFESVELDELLGFHGDNPSDGTCVHGPGITHESIFSSIIALDRNLHDIPTWSFLWRQGRPCDNGEWRNVMVETRRHH